MLGIIYKCRWLSGYWSGSFRTQSGRRRLGNVTLARSRVRVSAGYEFVSCRRHGDQRLPAEPIATALFICIARYL